MSYYTVTSIVEGSLDEEEELPDMESVQEFVNSQAILAAEDGQRTELYVIRHDHGVLDDGDCNCVQYLTDHAPYATFNREEEPENESV